MRAHASFTALALLTLSALPGCDKPDVGDRCKLAWNANWQADGTPAPPTPGSVEADYFESGNVACDNLICVVSRALPPSRYASCSGDQCGYCSKPCVSDRECYSDETGLYCEYAILDEAFIQSLDAETQARYLNQFRYSRYCVVPR